MQNNLRIFNNLKDTPQEARKQIQAGRLKGFTDINPMWRIKRLTEVFGPCGIGWKYEITNQRIVPGYGNEVAAFTDILLFYKDGDAWSEGIPGVGGSSFVATEKNGPHTSDECFKMALTDAIGTACKALGMSADIFYEKDRDKYNTGDQSTGPDTGQNRNSANPPPICDCCGKPITGVQFRGGGKITREDIVKRSLDRYGKPLCYTCANNLAGNTA